MSKIGIIDYGMGNLGSVTNACKFLELDAQIVTAPQQFDDCRAIILPGVGAFGDCMAHLVEHNFVDAICGWIGSGKPFLGICLGLQALFQRSEESPGVDGLGIFEGTVKRFSGADTLVCPTAEQTGVSAPQLKVPQIGWNAVKQAQPACPMFNSIDDNAYFYFVHSFYVDPADKEIVAGQTSYGIEYCSAAWKDNVFAAQFHPEKSQAAGLQMLRNFGENI